jgi:hypothetical protein
VLGEAVGWAAFAERGSSAMTGADLRLGVGVIAGRETGAEAGRGAGAASEDVFALAEFASG